MNTKLPAGSPALQPGVWTDITPAELIPLKGSNKTMIAQGIALDPCDVSTLYWCTAPFETNRGGLFKSTNAGASWSKIGNFDAPLHVRINPKNSLHLYVGDGVRGATMGFWVSKDGGKTWTKPRGFSAFPASIGITSSSGMEDVYDVAVDPGDFNHVLVSFHSPWTWNDSGRGAGVIESKDGGETWAGYEGTGWGYGHAVHFLHQPGQGIGNSNTWLVSTQTAGRYRTTDGGKSFTKVSDNSIFHGGGTIFYNKQGVLFASGAPRNMRSTDNGATWTLTPPGASTCVFGDGNVLYSSPALGENPYFTSPETDGLNWTPYQGGTQKWQNGGPFEMAFDATNGILYSSNWEQGAMAMKVTSPTR